MLTSAYPLPKKNFVYLPCDKNSVYTKLFGYHQQTSSGVVQARSQKGGARRGSTPPRKIFRPLKENF